MKTEKEKMISSEPYYPNNTELNTLRQEAQRGLLSIQPNRP